MPLQNRVTPTGRIIADPARGTLMGNRGVLHDDAQNLGTRRWASKAWIACVLEFKGTRRKVMTPNCYTELFFLNEATALAAGHRPCAECRRAGYNAFRAAWTAVHSPGNPPRAPEMDAVLHVERVEPCSRRQITHRRLASDLPDGTFVQLEERSWLVRQGRVHLWRPAGYGETRPLPDGEVTVLTPASMVAVLANGYHAAIHESVDAE